MKTGKHWTDIFNVAVKEVDVIMELLDSRNPIGTHNKAIETFIRNTAPHIQLFLVLNKSDMIPKEILNEWVKYFKHMGYDVITTSAKYKGGINSLLQKLRGMRNRSDNELCVMAVGYPNTGKSTLIQALTKDEKKLGTSSRAGFTRSIQKIKISKNLYLLDSPGVIPFDDTNETDIAMKSCMMADKLKDPMAVVESIFTLLPYEQFNHIYRINITEKDGPDEMIQQLGTRLGRIKSGGVVDENAVIKKIIRDWQSNTLRYFVLPPSLSDKSTGEKTQNRKEEKSGDKVGFPPSLKKR